MHINNHLIGLLLDQKLKIQQLQIRFSYLKQLRKLFQKCKIAKKGLQSFVNNQI